MVASTVFGTTRASDIVELEDVLGSQGCLILGDSGFSFRQQQYEMARAVADALDAAEVLVAEAGTGTGKTYTMGLLGFL